MAGPIFLHIKGPKLICFDTFKGCFLLKKLAKSIKIGAIAGHILDECTVLNLIKLLGAKLGMALLVK
jgi:hypothetical protein